MVPDLKRSTSKITEMHRGQLGWKSSVLAIPRHEWQSTMKLDETKPKEFFEYRGYLAILARRHLSNRYNGKVVHSDIVQQTLVNAYSAQAQCQGKKEAEILGWLRRRYRPLALQCAAGVR